MMAAAVQLRPRLASVALMPKMSRCKPFISSKARVPVQITAVATVTEPSTTTRSPPPPTPSAPSTIGPAVTAVAAVTALSIGAMVYNGSLFAWHPIFMSLGYLLFMTHGVRTALEFRALDGPLRVSAIQSHALWQGIASMCIIIAFVAIYRNKILLGKAHFMSLHARVGLTSLLLSVFAPLIGAVSFRKLGMINVFPATLQPKIKWLHRKAGTIAWVLSLVAIWLGLKTPAVNKGIINYFWMGGVAAVGVGTAVLAVQTSKK